MRAAIIVSAAVVTLVAGCSTPTRPPRHPRRPQRRPHQHRRARTAEAPISQTDFCTAARNGRSPGGRRSTDRGTVGRRESTGGCIPGLGRPLPAMVEAVPTDACEGATSLLGPPNESVQAIAEEGAQTQKQANAYGRAQGTVLDYYSQQCG